MFEMSQMRAPQRVRDLRLNAATAVLALVVAMTAPFPSGATASPAPRPRVPEMAPPAAPGGMDVTDYLAYYKAQAAGRARARQLPMTTNQEAYDVHYYDLDFAPSPTTGILSGTVRMRATVVTGPISTLDLDFSSGSMTVDAVVVTTATASFTHAGDLLTLQLGRAYASGEMVEVMISFHGTPTPTGFGSFNFGSNDGLPLIWSLSEPFGARDWWPCKDQPADKADSVDIRVTVPAGMKTASNGTRVESTDNGTVAVTRWRERYPIATYLVSVTSFAYSTSSDWYVHSPTDSMEIQFYTFPEDVSSTAAVNATVKDMLAAFAARFGPYPFLNEKYGHAEFPWGGAMEHQTCTSIGAGAYRDYIVAHELSHQWWGDEVTCRDFHHVWLNEGFATFSEAVWAEATGGLTAYHANMNAKKYLGPGTIYVPDVSDIGRIFSGSLSYRKASWVLHMLRHVLGDTTFFAALRAYRQQFPYGTAVTGDFQQVCETVSGLDLGRFFQQWIYGEYYPSYRLTHASTPATGGGYDVRVQLEQTQTWQLFSMPVDITIHTASGASTFVVLDSLAYQVFTFHLPDPPLSVLADENEWILRAVTYPVGVEEAPAAASLELAPPRPNPSSRGAELTLSLPRAGEANVALLDAAGRRVAEIHRGWLGAGLHHLRWDGRDARGHLAGAGIYWVCVEHGGTRRVQRLAVVR